MIVSEIQDIAAILNRSKPCLSKIEGPPFERSGSLFFSDGEDVLILRLGNVHLWRSHVSLFGKEFPGICPGPGCEVNFVAITRDSELLQEFLQNRETQGCRMFLYDSGGRKGEDVEFIKPLHVCLLGEFGIFEIVCEEIGLECSPE